VPRIWQALIGLAFFFLPVSAFQAAEPDAGGELYPRIVPSCAWVLAGKEGRGTGWLIDSERKWLITNFHVVGDAKTVDIVFPKFRDGRPVRNREEYLANMTKWRIEGKVIRHARDNDLALVELASVPASAKPLPLVNRVVAPGERVHILGNRRDLDQLWTYTNGHVSQRYRSREGYPWRTLQLAKNCRLLALQAPINDGDSGGPAVSDRGEVLGVTSAVLWHADRIAVAVDASEVRKFVFPKTGGGVPSDRESNLYERLLRALALVRSSSSTSRSSGFVIDRAKRLLLTTAHAVGPHERVELIFPRFDNGKLVAESAAYETAIRIRAGVVARDARRNLALLEAQSLPDRAAEVQLSSDAAKPGDELHSIQNPNGIDALWLYTALVARQIGRAQLSDRKEDGSAGILVLQGPGSANDSGGPVVNEKGQLVAVAGAKDGPEQQVTYAVDLSEIRTFLDSNRGKWDPKTADEFHRRGQRYMRIRQNDSALADFRRALRLQPKHFEATIDLSDLYLRLGNANDALATIRLALERFSGAKLALPLTQRAAIQAARGNLDDAHKDCDAAIKINPKCARAFAQRAEIWRRKKDLGKASADADQAAWLDANLSVAYLHRGLIQMDKRDWDSAISDFTRVVELDPFDPAPLRARSRAFAEKGDSRRAKQDQEAAKRLE
jgi:S1-C subfamily serine protease